MIGFGTISESDSESDSGSDIAYISDIDTDDGADETKSYSRKDEGYEDNYEQGESDEMLDAMGQPIMLEFKDIERTGKTDRQRILDKGIQNAIDSFPDTRIKEQLQNIQFIVTRKLYNNTNKKFNDENYAASLCGELISNQRDKIGYIRDNFINKKFNEYYRDKITIALENIPYILYRYSKYMTTLKY